jgi:hypothetical protein
MQSSSTGRGEGGNGGRDQGIHGIRMEMEEENKGGKYETGAPVHVEMKRRSFSPTETSYMAVSR